MFSETLTEPAKLLLLAALLAKDHIISNNGKAFLKGKSKNILFDCEATILFPSEQNWSSAAIPDYLLCSRNSNQRNQQIMHSSNKSTN